MERNFSKFGESRGILMFSGAQLHRNFGNPAAQLRGHNMQVSRYGERPGGENTKGPRLWMIAGHREGNM
jgi:hypothetical protein